ncbi:MAG: hypothetical protein Q9224_005727, partial [Gallowayella concinna]
MARTELYPHTPGRLRLRISPSAAFREEGKLLLPVTEPKDSYVKSDKHGESLEDVWKSQVVDKWLRPQEEVWAVKVFVSVRSVGAWVQVLLLIPRAQKDSIRVYGGLPGSTSSHKPEHWNTAALRNSVSHDGNDEGWNIPPESLMDELAKISLKLLNIDPRKSKNGIVLHTKRDRLSEWLRWGASMSFKDFMLEILYKIDDDAIAIYPADYEEPDDGTGLEREQSQAVKAMKEMKRKKTAITKDAAEQMEVFKKPRSQLPPFNKRYNNLGHPGIQLPHTVWNLEGTHLERAPSYAFTAPRYSASDMGLIAQRLMRAEEEILKREESCRVCQKIFITRSDGEDLDRTAEIKEHYRSHRMAVPRPCPQEDCQENLDDRDRFPGWAVCIRQENPLYLYANQQLIEHTNLHPNVSDIRRKIPESLQDSRRESSTQTNIDDLDPGGRYKPLSKDSLTELPEDLTRLRCNNPNCLADLRELTETELEAHAKKCNTSVDAFVPLDVRKGNTQTHGMAVIKSKQAPATRGRGNRAQREKIKSPANNTKAVDQITSSNSPRKAKSKADAPKPATGTARAAVQQTRLDDTAAVGNDASQNNKTTKEAKFASMVQKAKNSKSPAPVEGQSRKTRARSEPPQFSETDHAPTPTQLRSAKKVEFALQKTQEQPVDGNPPRK